MIPINCHLWQKEKLTPEDLDFEIVETIEESSHFDRSILRCKRCGQLYFYEFLEFIDWEGGDDKMHVTHIPIEEKDIEELKTKSSLELLAYSPRLQWDTHGENADKVIWIGKED